MIPYPTILLATSDVGRKEIAMRADGGFRQGLRLAMVATLAVGTVLAAASSSAPGATQLPERYYLALGDSIALRLRADAAECAAVGAHRVRRPLDREPAQAVTRARGRQLQLSWRIQRDFHSGSLSDAAGGEAARPVSGSPAQGGRGLPTRSSRTGQSDHPDSVGCRARSAVGEGPAGARGDRVVRSALRHDPAAASSRRA